VAVKDEVCDTQEVVSLYLNLVLYCTALNCKTYKIKIHNLLEVFKFYRNINEPICIVKTEVVTYAGRLWSPPAHDLLLLSRGILRRFEDGRPSITTRKHAFTLFYAIHTPNSFSEVDQYRRECTEHLTRTSLKDIKDIGDTI